MTELPEPTIIVDMDMMENQVYDSGDLAKYGRAEYLRAIEQCLEIANKYNWGQAPAMIIGAIRALGSKT